MQHGKPSKSEGGTLYGAKITGGGSGGTVCVIGRNCLRSSQQILEVILDQHDHRKMLIFLLYAFVPFIIVHMFLLFFEVANYK
jgi:L-arabinokinase